MLSADWWPAALWPKVWLRIGAEACNMSFSGEDSGDTAEDSQLAGESFATTQDEEAS